LRARRARSRWFEGSLAAVAFAGGGVLGAALAGAGGGIVGGLVGLLAAVVLARAIGGGEARRVAALEAPFPEPWRELLLDRYDHYDRLPDPMRSRFEDDLRLFLAEKRITGIGVEVDDELRVLVAASAVTLSLGWPDFEWEQLTEVLLYPREFDPEDPQDGEELAGEASAWGTVILSLPALLESFADPDDAYHVGIHEFAHLLELQHSQFEGMPIGLEPRQSARWLRLVEDELARMRSGRSVLDPYGTKRNHDWSRPVEFLAVAVEAFFEAPLALRQEHGDLYEILSEYFRQDPAAWDDERGLEL
jgi:Mlc titration factor MtfA (ptsG expression regulator)